MRYSYRCSIRRRCGKCVTLRKPIEQYVRRPKCPACGQDTLKSDHWTRIRDKRLTCKCGGVSFPHKRGLILNENEFCHHAEFDVEFGPIKTRQMKPDEGCPF